MPLRPAWHSRGCGRPATAWPLLPLLLLTLVAAAWSHGEHNWPAISLDSTEGRHLTQLAPQITEDLARSTMQPDPVDWHIYEMEVRSPYDLRSAICESQGDVYVQDPPGVDVNYCHTVGMTPKKIVVYLREDIILRGDALPPITGFFKVEGRCENSAGQICAIHAVSAICSSCPLPGEDASSNELNLCDACAFGGDVGRETTPFIMEPSAKLWLINIELAGCKTKQSGGCIRMRSGTRSVWSSSAQGEPYTALTYLYAQNSRFKRGYAVGEGGQVMVQAGSLAVFKNCTFVLNYASASGQNTEEQTADKSHDVMVTNYAAALLIRCKPVVLYVTATQLLPQLGSVYAAAYQEGRIFISNVDSTPPDPPPPPAVIIVDGPPAPADKLRGRGQAGDESSSGGGSEIDIGSLPLWLIIVVVLAALLAGATLMACCWWCCWLSPKDEDEEEEGLSTKGGKSMFDQVANTRGMVGKSMMRIKTRARSGMTNFSTRFQSAFKSTFKSTFGGRNKEGGSSRGPSRFHIPGTNATYSIEALMKGRMRQSQVQRFEDSSRVAWAEDSA
eukprot:jgi/Tetstr1/436545/TSEL_002700.t1